MKEKNKSWQKKISYYIKLILITPFWFIKKNHPNMRTWDEFKSWLITHKCEFEEEYQKDNFGFKDHQRCKHFGCFNIKPFKSCE